MRLYLRKVKRLLERLKKYEITQILKGENSHVDALVQMWIASSNEQSSLNIWKS